MKKTRLETFFLKCCCSYLRFPFILFQRIVNVYLSKSVYNENSCHSENAAVGCFEAVCVWRGCQ